MHFSKNNLKGILIEKKNFKKFLVYNKLIIKIYKFAPLKTLKKNLYYG